MAHKDAIAGFFKVATMNLGRAFANCEQRCFVHKIGEVGAAHAGSAASDEVEVDVGVDPLVANVYIENLATIFEFRQRNDDLAVESTGA